MYLKLKLLDENEGVVFHHTLANLYADGGYLSCFFSFKVVGHLHGLKYDNSVANLNLIAYSNFDVGDDTG